jgi:hypothetical protein
MNKEEQELIEHLTRPGAILKVVSRYADEGFIVEAEGHKLVINSVCPSSWLEPIYDPEVHICIWDGKKYDGLKVTGPGLKLVEKDK